MEELAVLLVGAVGVALGLEELENERAARADVGAPGEEITADEGLEDAGLAAALAADDGDLRELDRRLAPELREDVLELVHYGDHGVPERRRRRRRRRRGGRGRGWCWLVRHGWWWWISEGEEKRRLTP